MAQTKISQLTELSSIADNDYLAGLDTSASTTKKVKMSTLKSYINTGDAQDVQINGTSVVSGNVANIAVQGTYNASTNKIASMSELPTKTSELTNDSNFEVNTNKVTTIDSSSTDTQYPSAKATYDYTESKADDLENELAETQAQLDTYKTIFNALPKVSGTGEDISLDGTTESPLKMDLLGDTYQVSYTGKNLLDYTQTYSTPTNSTIDNEGWITASYNNTSGSSVAYCNYYTSIPTGITIKTSTTYTIVLEVKSVSATATGTGYYNLISLTNTNTNFIADEAMGNVQLSTLSNNTTYKYTLTTKSDLTGITGLLRTYVGVEAGGNVSITYRLTLMEGDVSIDNFVYEPFIGGTPSPSPSYPQPIQVVSGDNEVSVCGKNLVDTSKSTSGKQIYANGTINNNSNAILTDYIYVGGQSSITISFTSNKESFSWNTCFFDENKEVISGTGTNGMNLTTASGGKTYTITNQKYIRFDYANDSTDVMIEGHNAKTSYEPYTGTTYPINLPVENLFDKDNAVVINGYAGTTTIGQDNNMKSIYVACKPNTTYTISKTLSTRFKVSLTNSNVAPTIGTTISDNSQHNDYHSITITTNSDTTYIIVWYYYASTDVLTEEQIRNTIQIELGSKKNSFTPYGTTPIELCKIGTYQDNFIRNSGKNILPTTLYNLALNASGENVGLIVGDPNRNAYYCEIEPNTTYYISRSSEGTATYWYYAVTDVIPKNNVMSLSFANMGSVLQTQIKTPSNAKYLCVFMGGGLSNDVMVSKESTSYEPYGKGEWYLKKNIGKKIFVGATTGEYWAKSNNVFYTFDIIDYATSNNVPFSNYYVGYTNVSGASGSYNKGNNSICFINSTANSRLYVRNDSIDTAENFKLWLNTHNLIVYYALRTPTYTKIEGTLASQLDDIANATSYPTQTNISQTNNDLPFIIDAQTLLDISNLENRVTLLED